jgi:hypothetical protein
MKQTALHSEASAKMKAGLAVGAVAAGALLAIVVGSIRPVPLIAHGGGLDANGCHYDRKNGGYHCHRSPAAPTAPAVPRVPDRPSVPASPAPLAASGVAALPANAQITGTVVRFDRGAKVLVIDDEIAARFEIAMRDDTSILGGQRMDDYLESNPAPAMPWTNGQTVVVSWRPSADRSKRVAVSVR